MSKRLLQILKVVLCTLVLDGFTLALAMEASPELHHHIHHDAGEGDHDCLVTLLQHGGFESVLAAHAVPATDLVWHSVAWTGEAIRVPSFFLGCSIYEHGPPARA